MLGRKRLHVNNQRIVIYFVFGARRFVVDVPSISTETKLLVFVLCSPASVFVNRPLSASHLFIQFPGTACKRFSQKHIMNEIFRVGANIILN